MHTGSKSAGGSSQSAQALYDYTAAESDELTIFAGEALNILSSHDDGWYLTYAHVC